MIKILFVTLFLVSCTKTTDKFDNYINVALSNPISTLDPAVSYDTVSSEVIYQIHETLYEYDYLIRPYHLKPLLAAEMPLIENDGLKYTIKIKGEIQYHESPIFQGKKRFLKAQDFINSIKRLAFKSTKSNGWWLFDDKIIGLNKFRDKVETLDSFFSTDVEGLSAPNDQTLVIKLIHPYPQLMYALAMAFTTPIPEEIIKSLNNDLSQGSIGTGPFYLQEYQSGHMVKLEKFKDYHPSFYPNKGDRISYQNNLLQDKGKKLPFIDGVRFYIMQEAQTRWLNFLKRNIDFVVLTKDHFSIALDQTGQLNQEYIKEGIQLQIAPTLTYWWLSFNMTDPIVGKNLNLRKAIAHTIDIDRYIALFTNNIALKANSIYPPGVPGYDPTSTLPYKYDVKLAKDYLAKAGFPDGKGLPVINYDIRGTSTIARQMGDFIKAELEKIGLKINIVVNSFPGFLNKSRTGQLQFWQGGWAMDYPDAENVVQLLTTKNQPPGPNTSSFSHPLVDKYYKELAETKNPTQKKALMQDVEAIIHEHLPWVMQYYSRNYILHHKRVQNFRQSDLIYSNLKYLRLK